MLLLFQMVQPFLSYPAIIYSADPLLQYSCFDVIVNHYSVSICLFHAVSVPVIIRQPSAVTISIFESAVFYCSFQSFGNVKVAWRKERNSPTASERISKTKNVVTSKLRISRAVGYYSGNYYCVAENKAGTVVSSATYLHVEGKI